MDPSPSNITKGLELSPLLIRKFVKEKSAKEIRAALEILRIAPYGSPFFGRSGIEAAQEIESQATRAGLL